MNTKLTLRIDEELVKQAKISAKSRGKSVSQMFGEYIQLLSASESSIEKIPPVTSSLLGVLQGASLDERDYKKHLLEKYQ